MHHLIFEGPELAGKSWLMQEIYNRIEPKYNKSKVRLDGCLWLPSDIGIFGSKHGKTIIKNYLEIFKELKDYNYIMEKLHISDTVYNKIYNKKNINYPIEEKVLLKLNFKILLVTYPEDENILKSRIKGRLDIYPHYKNILQPIDWYFKQRQAYLNQIKKSILPYKIIETNELPDNSLIDSILEWIGEK